MALNLQTFKTRTLTAIVFAAVMLSGLLVNQWTFLLLFLVIHAGCWIEYFKLLAAIDPSYRNISFVHQYGLILLGSAWLLFMTNSQYQINDIQIRLVGWYAILVIAILFLATEIVFKKHPSLMSLGYSLLGLLYISISWGCLMQIRNYSYSTSAYPLAGAILPCTLIFSIWINDTMAYIVGSFIGKTPLSKISPKKTWEGTVGGALIAIAVVTIVASKWLNIDWRIVLGISSISSIVGTFGDLIESKLKRMAGVKDSGQIMPGHGGFLDRFDSLLLATPFVWLFLKCFMG